MRVLATLLIAVGLSLAATAWAEDAKPDDRVAQVVDRVAKMPLAEQQAWLRQLEQRERRASQIALKPHGAAKEQAEVHDLLYRKLITWKVLREAIEKVDLRERYALGLLRQRYRDQVAKTFAARADERDRRLEAWDSLQEAWATADRPIEGQPQLMDWLEAATRTASPKTVGPLPERPEFGGAVIAKHAKQAAPDAAKQNVPAGEKVVRTVRKPELKGDEKRLAGAVEIDADELGSRIAGCNMAFRELESDLDERGPWDAARLTPLVDRLKVLMVRRNDLQLFRDVASAEKRSALAALDSPKAAVSQLGARIFDARNRVSSPKFKGTEADRRAETERLESLSRRLADIAGK
ncbi:MAG: hypothetical protein ABFC96_16140 [Thermoguttaceae bacterium]